MGKDLSTAKSSKQETRTKILLGIIFLIGLLLVVAGISGMREFSNAKFHDETAYKHIQKASLAIEKQYKEDIEPYLNNSPKLDMALEKALIGIWSDIAKTDKTEQVESLKAESRSPEEWREKNWKLLSFSYAMDGPRIKEKFKKEITSLNLQDRKEFRQALLNSFDDEAIALPKLAQSILEKEKGEKSDALLIQSFLVSSDKKNDISSSEIIKDLKKSVRNADNKILAAQWAENKHVSPLWSFLVSNSKTIVLIGALLAINVIIMLTICLLSRDWYLDIKWLLILAIVDFLLVFQMLPLVYLVIKSLFPQGSFTLETFTRLYTYSMNLEAMKNTMIIAACTMVLGTLLAFPLAWLVGRTDLYGKKFFRSLFVLTYMVPPYVGAMAWLRLLNPNVGTINLIFRQIFNLSTDVGPLNIYSLGGLIWVLTTFYYPYAFITISRAMEKMDPSLEEASKISGANPIITVFRITLPMMMPSLIAGALLVFIGAASAYGIPSIIGTPGKIHTVTTRIVEYFGLGVQGLNDATGMAVFLMFLSMLILYLSDNVIAKKQYITVSGKSTRPSIVELRKWRLPLTIIVSLFACIVIFIPFLTILITSFKLDIGKSVFDPSNFTLGQWQEIFSRGETIMSLSNSLLFGFLAATIGIIVAITMSYLLQRTQVKGRKIPDFLITLSSSTPSVVIALGLIMTMKGSFGVNIYNTPTIIVIAYLLKYLMMGMRTVVSSMSQIHSSLEECSQISGASWLRTMLKITGPLIFPSIVAGWFLIFIPCFYELGMTTLLYSNTTKTIGFQLYEYWIYHSQPQACAMAFGILAIVVALNFVLNKVSHGEVSI